MVEYSGNRALASLRRYGAAAEAESSQEKHVCPVCRGDYKKCRLEICPYLKDARDLLRKIRASKTVFGSSPPSALVGSWGYPKVLAGPLVPPIQADTSLFDQPQKWLEIPLNDILAMRVSMIRGKKPVKVFDARKPGRLLESLQELAMARRPTDVELELEKELKISPNFLVRASPTGPSAPMMKIIVAENPSVLKPVERVVSDVDLKASEAIMELYSAGVSEQHIVRLLSMGLLGSKRWRRLVPTEWSITAVDDQLGRRLRARVKRNPWLNEVELYSHLAHFNRVTVLLLPGPWMFEVFEIWYRAGGLRVYHDAELPREPDRWPENVGGAYHALRLPILEKLDREGRQASALVIAEIYEGWIPLGVWRFREICRAAVKSPPLKFEEILEALNELFKRVEAPADLILRQSRVLEFHLRQMRLTDLLMQNTLK